MLLQPSPDVGRVGPLSLCSDAHFEIARAPLSALGMSDRSHCGGVLILTIAKETLCRDLDNQVLYRELAHRSYQGDLLGKSCTETSHRDRVQRSWQDVAEILRHL